MNGADFQIVLRTMTIKVATQILTIARLARELSRLGTKMDCPKPRRVLIRYDARTCGAGRREEMEDERNQRCHKDLRGLIRKMYCTCATSK